VGEVGEEGAGASTTRGGGGCGGCGRDVGRVSTKEPCTFEIFDGTFPAFGHRWEIEKKGQQVGWVVCICLYLISSFIRL
jgi:hypothetical protein